MSDQENLIEVEVAYALPEQQFLEKVNVPAKSSLHEAIRQSGVLVKFPDIDLEKNKVGVFGKVRPLDAELEEGDRVEIYRGLIADPKQVRKEKAAREKKGK